MFYNAVLILIVICTANCQTFDSSSVAVDLIDGFDTIAVREGDTMQLKCLVNSNATDGVFRWQHTSSKTGTIRNVSSSLGEDGLPRVIIANDLNSGNPTSILIVLEVTRNDEGTYMCYYTVDGKELSGSAVVHIAYLPEPECFKSHIGDTAVQHTLCVSEHAFPNVTLQWKSKSTGETLDGKMNISDGFVDNILNIDRIPGGDLNSVVCVALNPAFPDSEKTCDFDPDNEDTTEVPFTSTPTTQRNRATSAVTESSTEQMFSTIQQTEVTTKEDTSTGLETTLLSRSETSTNASTTTNASLINITELATGANGIFGMTEVIIVATAGGVIVLIFVILGILTITRLRRTPRRPKNTDVIFSFDTTYTTDTDASSNDPYINDTVGSQEYYVRDRMEGLDVDVDVACNDLDGQQMYGVVNKSRAQREPDGVQSISLNLYDSVPI